MNSGAGAQSSTLEVTVNGKAVALAADTSIADLVANLTIKGRYAVEINGSIVPRSTHAGHRLRPGDRVEIVQAIGGG